MNELDIQEVCAFKAFSSYSADEKLKLINLLQQSRLNKNQIGLLFNDVEMTDGVIVDAVSNSSENEESSLILGKIVLNYSESPNGSHPPVPFIKKMIGSIGQFDEAIALDVQKLAFAYIIQHENARVRYPAPKPAIRSGHSRLFSEVAPATMDREDADYILTKLIHNKIEPWPVLERIHDYASRLIQSGELKPGASCFAGAAQMIDSLDRLKILTTENLHLCLDTNNWGHVHLMLHTIELKPRKQEEFSRLIPYVNLSGPDLVKLLTKGILPTQPESSAETFQQKK